MGASWVVGDVRAVLGASRDSKYSGTRRVEGYQGLLEGVRGYFGGVKGCRGVRGVLGTSKNSQYSGTRRGIGALGS